MATVSNAGASFEEPHNVVHNDIACFSVAGHTGHMGDLNWSGFDPVLSVFPFPARCCSALLLFL